MLEGPDSVFRVPFDGAWVLRDSPTRPPRAAMPAKEAKRRLKSVRKALRERQALLYAHNRYALLLVFQAMDAAGKDGTIRELLQGLNPAGCQVFSFKQPSAEELDHDFLWRTTCRLPERGRIGVFNRSYYEEVLIVRVEPAFLEAQRLPEHLPLSDLFAHRFASIRDHELHLARNGTVLLKFFLNVSYEEQRRRFLDRLREPEKNWKFSAGDVQKRRQWAEYMSAYEAALRQTSRPHAPWYAIPADDKPFARLAVARIVNRTLKRMRLSYPEVRAVDRARFDDMRRVLESEASAAGDGEPLRVASPRRRRSK